jgi:hypothetical protein
MDDDLGLIRRCFRDLCCVPLIFRYMALRHA